MGNFILNNSARQFTLFEIEMIYVDMANVINIICKSRIYSGHIYIKEYSKLFSD